MNAIRVWSKSLLCVASLTLLSQAAEAREQNPARAAAVICQSLDADDLASSGLKIDNFDAANEAYIVCGAKDEALGKKPIVSGKVPLSADASELSLDTFLNLESLQESHELYVNAKESRHRVAKYDHNPYPLDEPETVLGPQKYRPVTEKVCKTEYVKEQECKYEPKEVCKTSYGYTYCQTVNEKVCKDTLKPVQHCEDKTVNEYYYEVPDLDGYLEEKAPAYCPNGKIEKQSKMVYGQLIEEQRCCETKTSYGYTSTECSRWEKI